MHVVALPARPRGLSLMLNWGRVRFTLLLSLVFAFLFSFRYPGGFWPAVTSTALVALTAMLVFGLFEQWPGRMPRWFPRWVLQVTAVGFVIPPAAAIVCALATPPGAPAFFTDAERMGGFSMIAGIGIFVGPWVALGTLVRQKEALARYQALEFDLERSELARQASDARLRLLQAQVAPHFLFNTLANVQALVDAGSPQASTVLRSLVAYLRAAVPRLNEPATTIGQELQLVRAYLELMHMRMPDRLQFTMHIDDSALNLRCPPMTLLTLVENAVRHGVDPSEEGGRIDIHVHRRSDRCVVRVSDTGAGLHDAGGSLGTGLSTLRERLQLTFGGDASLQIGTQHPRGVSAEIDIPAREST